MMNQIYFNLFMRNWKNNVATPADIDKAVELKYITVEQGEEIKATERNPI